MTTPKPPRWYCVNNMGMATLCADKADAEDVARTCDIDFQRQSPHRAVQLVEASALDIERTARQEAQQRLADLQEQIVRADAERCAAVAAERRDKEVEADPSCDDKRLAEMIMSDCGHSTNHTLLLERITHRIAAHVATQTEEAVSKEREACAEIAADDDHIVDVSGYYAQLGDVRATAYNIEKAIRARGAA